MKMFEAVFIVTIAASIAAMPSAAKSQSVLTSDDPSETVTVIAPPQADTIYERPTHEAMIKNYVFDTFGPYPMVGSGFAAGIGQLSNSPPEWKQGAKGYGRRFGSDFGMAATATTTRYALSETFKEDTLYYRCECSGVFKRLRHAMLSTVTARHGKDGHRTFSFSALVAPYAGSTVAVYGWYPDRFGAKDAFRIGNYDLLAFVGANVALEFLYSGPHSLLSRVHLNNGHGSTDPGPNH
jgi:hypothetical protein